MDAVTTSLTPQVWSFSKELGLMGRLKQIAYFTVSYDLLNDTPQED